MRSEHKKYSSTYTKCLVVLYAALLTILATLALTARAQNPTSFVIVDKSRIPSGITVLEAGSTSYTQFVIPRYYNGTTHPCGQLRGWGPVSVITATASTQSITPDNEKAIVITEGYNDDISEWQVGASDDPDPAVLQPIIADLTVRGYSTNAYAANDYVNDNPAANDQADARLYDGIVCYGTGGQINNVCVFYIPGTAIDIGRPSSSRNGGMLWHDRLKWNVHHVSIRRAFAGLYNHAVDSHTTNIEVEATRDYGVRLYASVHASNIHTYGCGYAAGPGGGPGLWLEDAANECNNVYVENGPTGLYFQGQHNHVNNCYSHTCTVRNVEMGGQDNTLNNAWLRAAPVNIRVTGDQNNITNTRCIVADSGIGIDLNEANNQNITNVRITGYKAADDTVAEGGTAIDIDDTINRCVIEATLSYIDTGIDFSGATIANDGSRIWITTDTVGTPVVWPTGQTWVTTVNAAETCDVRINGARYYRP